MNTRWTQRLLAAGFREAAARRAAENFVRVDGSFARQGGDTSEASAWWIPGRIEVLGKHTDYGGGRSLICAVERGLHLIAAPRRDGMVRIVDASTGAQWTGALRPDLYPAPGEWYDYPLTVARRIARDFPGSGCGMDATFVSSIPRAAGLSSSSALVIATFLPLAQFNRIAAHPRASAINTPTTVAGYLGAVENGMAFADFQADFGVGTHGGSEDHTAILCSRAGELRSYHYLPVTHEESVALPSGWAFVIASSGIQASKAGAVRAHYNALSDDLQQLLDVGRNATGSAATSLLALLGEQPDAITAIHGALETIEDGRRLRERLTHFTAECDEIIPGAVEALRRGDMASIGALVDRSQAMATEILRNQRPETVHLAASARQLGAAAASAFGAGFGGSVWALVPDHEAANFAIAWQSAYRERYPERAARSEFFVTGPGPGAMEIG